MITNLISFLYDINVDYIRKHHDNYIFSYNNSFYLFKRTFLKEEDIYYLNGYINIKSLFHLLIKNRYSRYLSSFNNGYFVLMKIKFKTNRNVLLEDICDDNIIISYVNRKNFKWVNLWKNKIDQVEYYINNSNIDIYNLSIINYYLSLGELAINYFNNNVTNNVFPITFCHTRMKKDFDLYDYYSILDVVFDHYIRDVSEYIKCDIYSSKNIDLSNYKTISKINDKDLLVARLMFPSYFFDVIDEFIINNRDFIDFYKFFIDIDIYEANLVKVIELIKK